MALSELTENGLKCHVKLVENSVLTFWFARGIIIKSPDDEAES